MSPTEPLRILRVREMQAWSERERAAGRRVGLVPTMGALHEGHLSLVRIARGRADRVVVSIFVNPTQFEPGADFDRYPRDLEEDIARLRPLGVDVVFCPGVEEVYPPGDATRVEVRGLTDGLCGRTRPGHFRGVTTVVARLFLATRPHMAVFGEKDYQQLLVIRRMAQDLHFDLEVLEGPTVREPDGLAMSSRNRYLGPEARRQATALNAALLEARERFQTGERDARRLIAVVHERLTKAPLVEVDYIECCDAQTLAPLERVERPALLALAVHLDGARLIDHTILEEG